jgi:hypothetical protein
LQLLVLTYHTIVSITEKTNQYKYSRDDTEEINVGIVDCEVNEDSPSSPIQP